MQRIIIYAHNEEFEGLEPLLERLRKKGASVHTRALKWKEAVAGDVHLTFKRYEKSIRDFHHQDLNLQFIDDLDDDVVPVKAPEPAPVPALEEEPTPEFNDDEPVVITAGDAPAPRRRKPVEKVAVDVPAEEPHEE